MAVDLLAGKAFEALYAGVEQVIRKNLIFSELCKDIKYRLDCLAPLIDEMAKYNQQLDRTKELEALEGLIKRGIELVSKCAKLRKWNLFKKWKYASEFLEFKESLQNELDVLKVQVARDVKKTEVGVENIQVVVHNIQEEVSMLVKQNGSVEIKALSAVLPELPALIVGLEVPIEELKVQLLKDEVSILIVTAPGGCGKTTLATKFCQYQDIKDKFQKNIFFVTFSKKPSLELIMKGLYEQKGFVVPTDLQNEATPVKWLKKVEMEKGDDPLLLVLDDVWSGSESLLEKFEYNMSNYKILVTSRSEFPRFGSSYHLKLLDSDNAMELFCHTASLGDKSSYIPKHLSEEIVKHCNGFPLAITVAGRSLCGQPEQMWRSRVDEWSDGSSILDFETELLLQLQSSIDVLDNAMPKVKECFLDLGAFPEDAEIPVAALIDMWAELYDLKRETSCIAKLCELNNRSLALLQKSEWYADWELAQESIDYSKYVVKQHDLLRELAIYNSKRDPIEHRERLIIEICGNNFPKWWREQKYPYMNARLVSITTDKEFSVKLPNMELPEAEVLVLNFQSETSYAVPEFVERMHKLKMLHVTNYSFLQEGMDNFELLGSLSNLTSLRLDGIDFEGITDSPIQLKNVHKLYLRRGGHFIYQNLMKLFPNLKEMVIEWSSIIRFPAGLCELIHLKKLKFTVNPAFGYLPDDIGNLVSLEVLRLETCPKLSKVPDSIGNLKKLKFLKISHTKNLKWLPDQMGKLTCLKHLIISGCLSLLSLPESIGDLINLEVLSLRQCYTLSELPESITHLQKLNLLDIDLCSKITELPQHIGELKSLRKLQMVGCSELRKLPESVSNLQQLEEVICDDWHATHLWTPLLPSLKNLTIVVRKAIPVDSQVYLCFYIHGFPF